MLDYMRRQYYWVLVISIQAKSVERTDFACPSELGGRGNFWDLGFRLSCPQRWSMHIKYTGVRPYHICDIQHLRLSLAAKKLYIGGLGCCPRVIGFWGKADAESPP